MFEAKYEIDQTLSIDQTIGNYWKKIPQNNWEGTQYSVPYDTAWVAALQNDDGKPIFPKSIDWLLQNQALNGSWGSHSFICERLLSTAACVRALLLYDNKYRERIKLGVNWLYANLPRLKGGNYIYMAGFEFLLPALLKQLDKYKIDLGSEIKYFQQQQSQKLSKLPIEAVLKVKTSKIFSLEFLDNYCSTLPNIDPFLEENGSLGATPSTTAWYLAKKISNKNPEMLQYLRHSQNNDGGYPSFADFQLYTITYVMYPLVKVSGKQESFKDILLHQFKPFWRKTGVAYAKAFPITDADDTAIGLYLMEKHGLISSNGPEWDAVNSYDSGANYSTYPYEVSFSSLTNLHVLDALANSQNKKREYGLSKLLPFFSDRLRGHSSSLGEDKYHISPQCQNCHGILALAQEAPELAGKILNWFLETRNGQGLWANETDQPTLEENAYAVLGICYYHQHVEKVDLETLTPAIKFLTSKSEMVHPSRWMSKIVYTPVEIVNAYILAALILYRNLKHLI